MKITHRGVAQLVARDVWDVDAAGSNPVTPTILALKSNFQSFFLCLLHRKYLGLTIDFVSPLRYLFL